MTKRKPVLQGRLVDIMDEHWDELTEAFPAIEVLVNESIAARRAALVEYETAAYQLGKVKGRRGLQGQDEGLTELRERLNARTRERGLQTNAEIVRLLKTRYIVRLVQDPPEE